MKPKFKNSAKKAQSSANKANAGAMQALFNEGLACHQKGLLAPAKAIYEQVLESQPTHFDAMHLLGVIAAQTGHYLLAVALMDKAIALDAKSAMAHNSRGNVLKELKRLDEALASYERAIQLAAAYSEAYNNRGTVLQELGRLDEALASYERAIQLKTDYAEAYYNRGNALQALRRFDAALASHEQAIKLKAGYVEAYNNRGNALQALQRFDAALASFEQAIQLKADYAEAYNNRGIALQALQLFDAALASYEQAIQLKADYPEAYHNRGNALQALQRFDAAVASYEQAIQLKTDYPEAYHNRGIALQALQRFDAAVASYELAIQLKPDYAEAYHNRGIALQALQRFDAAVASYELAIQLKTDYAEAYNNRGLALRGLRRLDAALASFEHAIKLNSGQDFLVGRWLHTKMGLCDWPEVADQVGKLMTAIAGNEKVATPWPVLALSDSLELQRKTAETWTTDQYPTSTELPAIVKWVRHEKIRVGYYSADYHNHATAYLMAELFERHDRNKFELIAFSFGGAQRDALRERLFTAFDQFIEVDNQSEKDIAVLSRSMEIDLAIDLKGFTENSRAKIFSYRAAPIQVSYLGYPGTLGAEYIDYLIADHTLIPQASQQHYAEKIAYLPNSYQVNDRKRAIAATQFSRAALGLPQTGFVFCCFNNNHKITPSTFAGWMRILKQVAGSVLWLLEDNETAGQNLRREASAHGVSAARLIFAKRMSPPDHLARHRFADLFLDTLPYNAHTTASDALWAGLPVLTCVGEAFASRVAASLLNAINLAELITTTQAQYELLAVELATNPERLSQIKQKLASNRLTAPLFDTALFTQHIEDAYTQMVARYHAGLPPDHLYVLP